MSFHFKLESIDFESLYWKGFCRRFHLCQINGTQIDRDSTSSSRRAFNDSARKTCFPVAHILCMRILCFCNAVSFLRFTFYPNQKKKHGKNSLDSFMAIGIYHQNKRQLTKRPVWCEGDEFTHKSENCVHSKRGLFDFNRTYYNALDIAIFEFKHLFCTLLV